MNKPLKYIFSFFIFIFPFFFIPNNYFSQELGKTFFLILFALFLLINQLLEIIKNKKVYCNFSIIFKLSSIFFLSTFFSCLFSKNIGLSLWGKGMESFIALFSIFIIFYFSRLIDKKDIFSILKFFVVGVAVSVSLFFIGILKGVQLEFFLGLSSLSIIVSLAFIILFSCAFKNINYFKKDNKYGVIKIIIFVFFAILFLAFLAILDYRISWFLILVGFFFVFWSSITESKFNFKNKKAFFSLFLLLFFLFIFFFQIPFAKKIDEPRLSYGQSFSIAQKSLKESPKNFIFGSGLGTYSYQYSLYKNKEINLIAPNFIFKEGNFSFVTFIVTMGSLGAFSLLILIVFLYSKGFREFTSEKKSIFPIIFCLSLTFFFYRIDIFLIMLFFLFLGLSDDETKEADKKEKKPLNVILFLITIFFFFSTFIFLNYIKSDIYYKKSVSSFQKEEPVSRVIVMMEKSVKSFELSDYYISLSSLYLLKAKEFFEEKWISKEKIEEQLMFVEENVLQAEEYIKKACKIDPNNFQAWQRMGLLYENVDYLIGDKKEDVIFAYEKAKTLAPQNYEIYLSLGDFFAENKDYDKALIEYKKALEVNYRGEELKEKIKKYEK
jgi:tetratricopeptide (TPR) repeat protein